MDNIHNDELSGGSNKGNIDDRMGGNKNKGIQNKKAKYNKKITTVGLIQTFAVRVKKILRSLMKKIGNNAAYAAKI